MVPSRVGRAAGRRIHARPHPRSTLGTSVAAALSALPLVIACSAWSAGPGVARALGWEGLGYR